MFNGQNQPDPLQNQTPSPVVPPAVKFDDIHVMPDRFLSPDARKNGNKKSSNTVLIIILVAVLLVGGGAAATVYIMLKPKTNANNGTTNQLNVNTTPPVNKTNSNLNGNTNRPLNSNINGSTNGNTNSLINFNRNLNTNLSLNTNATNLNSNGNSNSNGSLTNNSNTNSNVNTNVSISRTVPLPSTTDTDTDGLTDVEEALYGTMANKPDTDADGFIDGKKLNTTTQCGQAQCYDGEVYNGYNPMGNGYLSTSGLVKSFSNTSFNYTTLYPYQWVASATTSDNRTILFTPSQPTGETIQIIVLDNPSKVSAINYYLSINPVVGILSYEIIVANGLEGVRSPNGEDVYFAKGDKIYHINYSVGQLQALNFRTTFDVIYQNFRLTAG